MYGTQKNSKMVIERQLKANWTYQAEQDMLAHATELSEEDRKEIYGDIDLSNLDVAIDWRYDGF